MAEDITLKNGEKKRADAIAALSEIAEKLSTDRIEMLAGDARLHFAIQRLDEQTEQIKECRKALAATIVGVG
jgi:hypothetical protein